MLPLGSIFYAFLRPKTLFWKSNKGIKNAACNACIANDISSPPGDHRKKSLIFGGNPLLKKQIQTSATGACVNPAKN
jgi:hypothetical protein